MDSRTAPNLTFSITELIAKSFYRLLNYLERGIGREFFVCGGRGSCKSSFVSLYCLLAMIRDACLYKQGKIGKKDLSHTIGYRKYATDVRDSIFAQFLYWIDRLQLTPWFDVNRSNMRITFIPTGQMIMFRGLDDPIKSKSIKAPFGFFKYTIFEEATQFAGYDEIRSVKQSVQRGGHGFKTFLVYNPPQTLSNWINAEATTPADGRFVFRSDYRAVPREWLGEDFIADAEDLAKRNPIVYRHEYLGEVTGTGGAVFPNLVVRKITDDEIGQIEDWYFGIDWGFTNAFVWVKVAYQPKRKRILICDEIYLHHAPPAVAARAVLAKEMYGEPIWADSEDPAAIAQFNNEFGLTTYPVKKFPDSRRFSFRWLQGLHEIIIDPWRCPNCKQEFSEFEYKRDTKTGQWLDEYPKVADHSIDAVRYSLLNMMMTIGLF